MMDHRPLSALRPHPRNTAIYHDGADGALIESVQTYGILEALLITDGNVVISGHRRLDAARKVGLAEVPVAIVPAMDDTGLLDLLLHSNRQRAKTNEQVGREYAASLEVEAARAKERQSEAGRSAAPGRPAEKEVQVSAPLSPNGKARDLAAQRIGAGRDRAERSSAVVQVVDRLEGEGKSREASQLRTSLNNASPSRAYAEARERGYIAPQEKMPVMEKPEHSPVITLDEWEAMHPDAQLSVLFEPEMLGKGGVKFNTQSTDHIEWALWSWNPVTGCKHDCSYCYARDIAVRRYAHGFVPAFLPGRLGAAANTSVPPEAATSIAHKNVFTCSMADLFGKWVPREWIEAVLKVVRDSPQWNFLFLTKFPTRLAEFEFPDNAWLGTSVDAQARIPNAEKAFVRVQGGVKWLSCEPMLERLTFSRLDLFDWVVIGGASRSTQTPEFRPPREWVTHLERQAEEAGCKVYEKTNLLERRREYPGAPEPVSVVVPDAFKMGYLQRDVLPMAREA